jgi:hypothetical protein
MLASSLPQILAKSRRLLLPGVAGARASTPDAAPLRIVGDIDLRCKAALANWVPATTSELIVKDTGASRSYGLYVETDGTLRFLWTVDGTTSLLKASTVAVGAAPGTALWVRATLAVATGQVTLYTSADGSVWTRLGNLPSAAGATSIFSGTQLLAIGALSNGSATLPAAGAIYRAQIRNNILDDGTGIVFDADFTRQRRAALTFNESSTNAATVTINGTAAIV